MNSCSEESWSDTLLISSRRKFMLFSMMSISFCVEGERSPALDKVVIRATDDNSGSIDTLAKRTGLSRCLSS